MKLELTVRRAAFLACVLLRSTSAGAADCSYSHTYLGNLPKEGNPGWHSETQGIDHDDWRWYISQNPSSTFLLPHGTPLPDKCGRIGLGEPPIYSCVNPRLWRIPASVNLARSVSCNDPHTSGADATVCSGLAREAPHLWAAGYNHYGDIDYYEPAPGQGYVCVPLEGKLQGAPSLPGAFAFFRADDFSFVAFAEGEGLGATSAWCAIDPSGFLYSSPKNAAGLTDTVLKYRVDWPALSLDPPEARVELAGAVSLQDEIGAPLALGEYLQGGTFADGRLLYLLNGKGEGSCSDCGIHAFELAHAVTGGACGESAGDCVARRVAQSTNGSGPFDYEFHPGWSRYEEPEGLTWWDLSAPDAPAIDHTTTSGYRLDQTQLHAILLDNDSPDADDVYVKHYQVDIECSAPEAAIRIEPVAVDFGDVDIGASEDAAVRVSNVGAADLTVDVLAITGGEGAFQIAETSPAPPIVIAPSASTLVALRFTPEADGLVAGTLSIGSDDAVRPVIAVPLSGEGLSLVDQARQLLELLDEGLGRGLLVGVGRGSAASNRVAAFREMLERALALIEAGDVAEACDQLEAALLHVDGEGQPGDFITGAERASLATEIEELRSHLGCEAAG